MSPIELGSALSAFIVAILGAIAASYLFGLQRGAGYYYPPVLVDVPTPQPFEDLSALPPLATEGQMVEVSYLAPVTGELHLPASLGAMVNILEPVTVAPEVDNSFAHLLQELADMTAARDMYRDALLREYDLHDRAVALKKRYLRLLREDRAILKPLLWQHTPQHLPRRWRRWLDVEVEKYIAATGPITIVSTA